jgi:putative ABC transport system permease protein
MPIMRLAFLSLLNRRFTAALTVATLALSTCLLLGVERVRNEARSGFANTIAGTDLIVGARTSSVPLMLYSVFRIGNPTNNVSWRSYEALARDARIAWTVPLSLGDSHRGFPVLGTTEDYFTHYRYARERGLEFSGGAPFADLYDAVIGAEVARKLDYRLGQSLVIAHGAGPVSLMQHDDKPFRVAGILAPTGTPVDRTVHVSLQAIEAIHIDWQAGVPARERVSADTARHAELQPKTITAFLVGLKSRIHTFQVQRAINDYREEPLTAVIPGVALQELWDTIGMAEQALLAISALVILAGLAGMQTALLASLNERRREMAILRAIGAGPRHVFALLMGEAAALTALGALLGLALLYVALALGRPFIESQFGLFIPMAAPSLRELALLGAILAAGLLSGAVPSYRAYRYSVADGMTIRV